MTNKDLDNEFLTQNQITDLVQFIEEEFDSNLSGDELIEVIGHVLENVPGIESETSESIEQIIRHIGNQYHDRNSEPRST